MIRKIPASFRSVIKSNNGLELYLNSLLKGRPATPRSWLYENKEPKTILENWMAILSKLEKGSSQEQKVFQFDTSQLEKWGPQGQIAPIADLLDDVVLPTFSQDSPPARSIYNSSDWKRAIRQVSGYTGIPYGLVPESYSRVIDDMRARDTLESNSGWPDFTRRSKPEVKAAAINAAKDGEWQKYPAIALFRNYNQKTRLVWMFPMSANLVEGSFMQVVQRSLIANGDEFFAPWHGFDNVRDLITLAYDTGKFVSATDFSKTDEHFRLPATLETFKVLAPHFQVAAAKLLEATLHNMHQIPLLVGPKSMITGEHGVSSGSNWTNFIETIFDYLLSTYVSYQYPAFGLYAIGDDMAWISNKYNEDFPTYISEVGKSVGQDINVEKVTNDPDSVKTLQRLFQRGYRRADGKLRGVYSTIRALKSSVYPERFHNPKLWNSDMFCARQFMILENCVDHPLFEEFVKYVVLGQKDLIPFAKKSSADLARIHRETKLLPGLNTTYNQEKRDSSLAAFKSIEYARTL